MIAALGSLLAGACSPVAVLNALSARDDVREARDLAYAEGPRHGVDVYTPNSAAGAPVVVFFYGGSWSGGEREMYRFVGTSLASAGIVCMVPDYRVFPTVRFPAFMHDAAKAVAWAKQNARRHGGDPDRLMLMGHSAGAQIATLLALDDRYLRAEGLQPARTVRGVVGLAGPYDFLPLTTADLRAIFGPERDWPASQPVNFAAAGAPPMMLATGDADGTVLPRNTASLARALRASGNAVDAITYPGIGHREIIGALAPPLRFLAPVRDDVVRFVSTVNA